MGLYVVKPGKKLAWPLAVCRHLPVPERFRRRAFGYAQMVHRKGVERAAAGYCVDLDAPYERIFCHGQEGRLMPVSELPEEKRPKAPATITEPAALACIAEAWRKQPKLAAELSKRAKGEAEAEKPKPEAKPEPDAKPKAKAKPDAEIHVSAKE